MSKQRLLPCRAYSQ